MGKRIFFQEKILNFLIKILEEKRKQMKEKKGSMGNDEGLKNGTLSTVIMIENLPKGNLNIIVRELLKDYKGFNNDFTILEDKH
jgi:hypothetical protein